MTFDIALRLTEILMALAFLHQSAEHFVTARQDRILFGLRFVCALVLLSGLFTVAALAGLAVISLIMLHRFQGPFNGGSDKMSLLILWCVLGVHVMPVALGKDVIFGYLALQLTLSYFISGRVKLMNPDWRDGTALGDVFAFSAYPVSENLRDLSQKPRLLKGLSRGVIAFELLFPLALLHPYALYPALVFTAGFHLANACLFGLNRFFWIWLVAYPSLIWFQDRVFGS